MNQQVEDQQNQEFHNKLMELGAKWKEKLAQPFLQELVKAGKVHISSLVKDLVKYYDAYQLASSNSKSD